MARFSRRSPLLYVWEWKRKEFQGTPDCRLFVMLNRLNVRFLNTKISLIELIEFKGKSLKISISCNTANIYSTIFHWKSNKGDKWTFIISWNVSERAIDLQHRWPSYFICLHSHHSTHIPFLVPSPAQYHYVRWIILKTFTEHIKGSSTEQHAKGHRVVVPFLCFKFILPSASPFSRNTHSCRKGRYRLLFQQRKMCWNWRICLFWERWNVFTDFMVQKSISKHRV